MAVVTSVHIADVGLRSTLRLLRRIPRGLPGLRHADLAVTAPLRGGGLPAPQLGRVVLVASWDGEEGLDRFVAEHPVAAALAGGWSARLEPLRLFGEWHGIPDDLSRSRRTEHDGPAVVLTLGRTRLSQVVRFLRTSAGAEASAVSAPGMVWGTAMARPPFVGTCSLWESTAALSEYAYGRDRPGHDDAIAEDRRKPFHHIAAFVRFRPLAVSGKLDGRNPLRERALAV